MIANIKHLTTMEIMEVQEKLSNTLGCHPSINHYMVHNYSIDWDKDPIYREIAQVLEATMTKDINGHWIDKDILD